MCARLSRCRSLLAVALFASVLARGDECAKAPAGGQPAAALFALARPERFRADFTEEKRIELLAKPIKQSGKLYFDRARGIVRVTEREKAVLTASQLRVARGGKVEEVPLDRSKTLRGFALSFPALLRGDEKALAATFDLRLEGDPKASWTLAMWPKDTGLCSFLKRVEVTGEGADVKRLLVEEVSGDVTDTRFGATVREVPPAELDAAFGGK